MMMMIIVRDHDYRGGHKHVVMMTVMLDNATRCSEHRAGAD